MASTNGGFRLLDPEAMSISSDISGGSTTGDEQSEIILTLGRKSVQPYKTKDEYLYAMKEDLSEWFNTLYDVSISADNFYEGIETGVLLCQHANAVQDFIRDEHVTKNQLNSQNNAAQTLDAKVSFRPNATVGTFYARDNIGSFLKWCAKDLGIPDDLRFETEDLVNRKHERNVILCLLEVARRGAKYGMLAPVLIQFEQEIDRELAGDSEPRDSPLIVQGPQPQLQTCDLMSLDEMVSVNNAMDDIWAALLINPKVTSINVARFSHQT